MRLVWISYANNLIPELIFYHTQSVSLKVEKYLIYFSNISTSHKPPELWDVATTRLTYFKDSVVFYFNIPWSYWFIFLFFTIKLGLFYENPVQFFSIDPITNLQFTMTSTENHDSIITKETGESAKFKCHVIGATGECTSSWKF